MRLRGKWMCILNFTVPSSSAKLVVINSLDWYLDSLVITLMFYKENLLQGSITSVPERALAAIPVQILCCKKIYIGEKDCEANQNFNSLWKHVLNVVQLEKYFSGNTKYQHNFILMLQEILRTNSHLLTTDEKMFLGI